MCTFYLQFNICQLTGWILKSTCLLNTLKGVLYSKALYKPYNPQHLNIKDSKDNTVELMGFLFSSFKSQGNDAIIRTLSLWIQECLPMDGTGLKLLCVKMCIYLKRVFSLNMNIRTKEYSGVQYVSLQQEFPRGNRICLVSRIPYIKRVMW